MRERVMVVQQRISAGAIIIRKEEILLVRYKNNDGDSYLVGPGGGALNDEGINQTVIREVREETGLEVSPQKILFVEDLIWRQYRIMKTWFLCDLVGGKLDRTQGAVEVGIGEAIWYCKEQLRNETVYPFILMIYDWDTFFKNNWETKYLGFATAKF